MIKNLIGKWFSWFGNTWMWKFVAKYIVANIAFAKPKFPAANEIGVILDILSKENEQGTYFAFVSSHRSSLSAKLINAVDSDWTHAGFLHEGVAKHMTAKDYTQQSIFSLLREGDDFAIVAFKVLDVDGIERFIEKEMMASEYDYSQGLDNGRLLYCSEAVFMALKAGGLDLETHENWGRQIFSPDDVYQNGKLIYEYRSK